MTGAQAKAIRQKLELNQHDFWGRVHCTQSAASRLESGEVPISRTLGALLVLAYGTDKQSTAEYQRLRGA